MNNQKIKLDVKDLYNELNLTVPVNVEEIVKASKDFITFGEDILDDSVEGVCDNSDPNRSYILINENIDPNRRIWTIAHELGHAYQNHRGRFSCGEQELYSFLHKIKCEEEANNFACELLMPEKEVRKDLSTMKEMTFEFLEQMSNKYKTSLSSTANRFILFSKYPIALAFSSNGKVSRYISSDSFIDGDYKLHLNVGGLISPRSNAKTQNHSFKRNRIPGREWLSTKYKSYDSVEFIEESFYNSYETMTLLVPSGDLEEMLNDRY